jgi:hypothetical protein
MGTIDDDWENFLHNGYDDYNDYNDDIACDNNTIPINNIKNHEKIHSNDVTNIPKCSDIYISTKTKISYLNKNDIDIKQIFWKIPVMDYSTPKNGIIKKQIKYSSTCKEEVAYIEQQLTNVKCYEEQIIEHIENPEGRIKYKDQRKISIGTCKKDLLSYRSKKKRAFFNCFVIIMRLYDENKDIFKEMHIKVFNTGKLEIPGIQCDIFLEKVLHLLVATLKPSIGDDLCHLSEKSETVLINSNFNCGYYIDREKLYDLLKYQYRINSNFDACSYPGIQSKFYYDNTTTIQTGQQPKHKDYDEVSFMIFRTGSVLIVGKCEEYILYKIYDFIKNILETEYNNIHSINKLEEVNVLNKTRKKKIRKKIVLFDYTDQSPVYSTSFT